MVKKVVFKLKVSICNKKNKHLQVNNVTFVFLLAKVINDVFAQLCKP